MNKTEAIIASIVLSFAAGILAWSYTADYRSAQSVAALDSLREQCKGLPDGPMPECCWIASLHNPIACARWMAQGTCIWCAR